VCVCECVRVKNRKWFPPISNTNAPPVLTHDPLLMKTILNASYRFEDLRKLNILTLSEDSCSDLNADTTFIKDHYNRTL